MYSLCVWLETYLFLVSVFSMNSNVDRLCTKVSKKWKYELVCLYYLIICNISYVAYVFYLSYFLDNSLSNSLDLPWRSHNPFITCVGGSSSSQLAHTTALVSGCHQWPLCLCFADEIWVSCHWKTVINTINSLFKYLFSSEYLFFCLYWFNIPERFLMNLEITVILYQSFWQLYVYCGRIYECVECYLKIKFYLNAYISRK